MKEKGKNEDLFSYVKSLEDELSLYKSEYATLLDYNSELRNKNRELKNKLQQITESDSYKILLNIKKIYNVLVPKHITTLFKRVCHHSNRKDQPENLHSEPQMNMHCKCSRIDIIVAAEQKLHVAEILSFLIRRAGLDCEIIYNSELYKDDIPYIIIWDSQYHQNCCLPQTYFLFVMESQIQFDAVFSEIYRKARSVLCTSIDMVKLIVENFAPIMLPFLILLDEVLISDWEMIGAKTRQFSLGNLNSEDIESDLSHSFIETGFYFYRFLLAFDLIDFSLFMRLSSNYFTLGADRICLSLPEAFDRSNYFNLVNRYGFKMVPGLRHVIGWVGCGLSYKMIFSQALAEGLETVTVCEDDVGFPADFEKEYREVMSYLSNKSKWDVFLGFMADVVNVHVDNVEKLGGKKLLKIDHMISMVMNIYNKSVFEILSKWDYTNRDKEKNTIDMYLNGHKLDVYLLLPFMCDHCDFLNSTIWDKKNGDLYYDMKKRTESRLERFTADFESK